MAHASIIIPCYNAERFIETTVASALRQTVKDIEVICVDDGSTDATFSLLTGIAQKDARVRVIAQANAGEGPARDAGLAAATGTWLYFLDSDDLMEPTLLADAIEAGERDQSDVVIFQTITVNEQTGEEMVFDLSFVRDWIPEDSFDPQQHPERIFNSFQNWVHNKLFRASFVRDRDLHMQHVHRSADILFTCRALAEADRITLLEKPLHRYRTNNPQSAMSTSDSYPLDFLEGFYALRAALEDDGTWELYHDSFVNWAIEGIVANLECMGTYEGFNAIARELADHGFERLDIAGFDRTRSDNVALFDLVHALMALPPEQAIFEFYKRYRTLFFNMMRIDLSRTRMQVQDSILGSDIQGSVSYKIGRAVTALPRAMRDLLP